MLTRFGKILTYMIFCLICSASLLSKIQAKASAEKILNNMTYFTQSPDVPKLSLIDGSRTAYYGRLHVSLNLEGRYVFGDFNRDGLQDAAAVIFENEGGNLDDYSLAFLINDGTKLVHTRSAPLDFWAIINSVREHAGKVVVDMLVHQDGDCNAGPTKRVKKVFDYLELSPDTRVPVAQAQDAPSETDLRYADRNQEIQDIYNTHIPEKIRKIFDRSGPFITRKFMVIELTSAHSRGFEAVFIFEGSSHPFRARFAVIGHECVLRHMAEWPETLDESFLDETHSLAYERFWL